MRIYNKKLIGLIIIFTGLGVVFFWGNIFVKMIYMPFSGTVAEAKVIGFKTKGSKWITQNTNSGNKNIFTGKSPFFEFESSQNETIKTYSSTPQIFILFNYEIGEKINIVYPKNEAQKAIILSWKEYPGLVFMITLGIVFMIVGKSYLFQKGIS